MTAPTPKQMRALADEAYSDGARWRTVTALRAAADELDRLRMALKDADDRLALGALVNLDGERFVDHPVMQMLAERNERMRAVMKEAPHDEDCGGWVWSKNLSRWHDGNCDCWKADAL